MASRGGPGFKEIFFPNFYPPSKFLGNLGGVFKGGTLRGRSWGAGRKKKPLLPPQGAYSGGVSSQEKEKNVLLRPTFWGVSFGAPYIRGIFAAAIPE